MQNNPHYRQQMQQRILQKQQQQQMTQQQMTQQQMPQQQMPQQQVHQNKMFFYSKNCLTCAKLIILMRNMNMLLHFNVICIEDMRDKGMQIPKIIQTVPALLIPQMNKIMQGKETFMWIQTMQQNMIRANMMKNAQTNGPDGYMTSEMSGFSDSFAYTDNESALPKSFLPCGRDDEYSIFTGLELPKLSDKQLEDRICEMEKAIKNQTTDIKQYQDQERQKALENYKKQSY